MTHRSSPRRPASGIGACEPISASNESMSAGASPSPMWTSVFTHGSRARSSRACSTKPSSTNSTPACESVSAYSFSATDQRMFSGANAPPAHGTAKNSST